jgi:hypothetical protein
MLNLLSFCATSVSSWGRFLERWLDPLVLLFHQRLVRFDPLLHKKVIIWEYGFWPFPPFQ